MPRGGYRSGSGRKIGSLPWNKGMKGVMKAWNKGKKLHYQVWNRGLKGFGTGSKNGLWKGDDVGYDALHTWVARKLGKPDTCEHCGMDGLIGRQIHWANKSHEYKRDLTDWIRLCRKCHRNYDVGNILISYL